jgi:UDP-2,3-diacylglucosamine pyrophosphatase LpxH
MLAVISDLHFEEEKTDAVQCPGKEPVTFQRNVKGSAYTQFIARIAGEAERNATDRLDLVLAGDIFDLHRTSMWFDGSVRPYVGNGKVDTLLESKVLSILDAIAAEPEVGVALRALQRLGIHHTYFAKPDDPGSEKEFPAEVHIYYLPGNHDRLANATDAIRSRVSQLLGLPTPDGPFPHELRFSDPSVLIRHGHEYDRYNFSSDHRNQPATFPLTFPAQEYEDPTLGDFVTVEVACQLAYLFRKHHEEKICSIPLMKQVYLRLLEFDDVRPQSALVDFLLNMPELGVTPEDVWKLLDPVVHDLFDRMHHSEFLLGRLGKLHDAWHLDTAEGIKLVLSADWLLKHMTIPLSVMRLLSWLIGKGGKDVPPEDYAKRESLVRNGEVRFVIAGHTHNPAMELVGVAKNRDHYYVDTGTWRNRVLLMRDRSAFGRLKALTYAVVYGSQEDRGDTSTGTKLESIDYWSGFTQRW